jgi:Heterokaryon incompatibility protein (HET)
MESSSGPPLHPIVYRPLDISKCEIRLLSFENTPSRERGTIHLNTSYVSLNDWKPEYLSFRDQNRSTLSVSQLCAAWKEGHEFTLATPKNDILNTVTRFNWGDYICLSYVWGDYAGNQDQILVDGIATTVSKRLVAALRDLQSSLECQVGMKVWVDALCINQTDTVDRCSHVLRVRDIFGHAFAVTAWTKEDDELHFTGLTPPGERIHLCEVVLSQYGRQVLEELLGVRDRNWGVADDEDDELTKLVEDVDVLVFDQYHLADSDDEDDFGFGKLHIRDLVRVELWQMLKKEYWSRLWIIQELAVSSMTTMVHWGESVFNLSTLLAVGDILLTYYESQNASNSMVIWAELKLKLDLFTFIKSWETLEIASGDMERSLNDDSIQQLKSLAARANCSLQHDRIYALLGLFPLSVSSVVTIDYGREAAKVMADFSSAVPQWAAPSVENEHTVPAE